MHNEWKDTSEIGFRAERALTEFLNESAEHTKFDNISEVYGPDIRITLSDGSVSYGEVKYYDAWYLHTSIETKCLDSHSMNSGWLFDDKVSRLFVMHSDFVYIYDANLLRDLYRSSDLELYNASVKQGKGQDDKTMEFISVAAHSSVNSRYSTKSEDFQRWDFAQLDTSPLLSVIRMHHTDELEHTEGVTKRREMKALRALFRRL